MNESNESHDYVTSSCWFGLKQLPVIILSFRLFKTRFWVLHSAAIVEVIVTRFEFDCTFTSTMQHNMYLYFINTKVNRVQSSRIKLKFQDEILLKSVNYLCKLHSWGGEGRAHEHPVMIWKSATASAYVHYQPYTKKTCLLSNKFYYFVIVKLHKCTIT